MHITRLCVEDEHKEYHVLDEFKLDKDVLKRKSCYDYELRSNTISIEDEMLKGRLK